MKFILMMPFLIYFACMKPKTKSPQPVDLQSKKYWYSGEAEISSYNLTQARYGELHEGQAVMIFVTEPFSPERMVKADYPVDEDVSVLKLNFTKNFNTGIYPYSMMQSTFFPFENGTHSLKISASSQEWCGHTYMELQNKKNFEIEVKSYFENESGSESISNNLLEDDIWSMIRLHPEDLPEGNSKMIPSFFDMILRHRNTEALPCTLTKGTVSKDVSSYTIDYSSSDRMLVINYQTTFPHKILGWEETIYSGYGSGRKKLTTIAELQKSIKSAYWTQNKVADGYLREEMGLR